MQSHCVKSSESSELPKCFSLIQTLSQLLLWRRDSALTERLCVCKHMWPSVVICADPLTADHFVDSGLPRDSLVVRAFLKGSAGSLLRCPSTPTIRVSERSTARQPKSRDRRDFAVITDSSAIASSENLWSAQFRPGSAHNDGLSL